MKYVAILTAVYLLLQSAKPAFGGVVRIIQKESKKIENTEKSQHVVNRRHIDLTKSVVLDHINNEDKFNKYENAKVLERLRRATENKGYSEDERDWKFYTTIIVPGVAFTIAVVTCSIFCCRKKKKNPKRKKLKVEEQENEEDRQGTFLTSASYHKEHANGAAATDKTIEKDEHTTLLKEKNVPNDVQDISELSSEASVKDEEPHMRPIRKGLLAHAVQKLASTEDGYRDEYEKLRKSDESAYEYSQTEDNKLKNRFRNILPYNRSLVLLTGGDGGDYINASYITGYNNREKTYIATQGPLESTAVDFWRMIWQEETCEIIMLANLVENKKKKCSKYWPDESKTEVHGEITVCNMGERDEIFKYRVRRFEISKDGDSERRIVRQYHYIAWGDMSDIMSATPIWELLKQMREDRKNVNERDVPDGAPIVIHCSAGCGRTGTVITLDVMRQMMKNDTQVDIFNFVNQMREERMMMVQVMSQYRFIYESLLIHMRLKKTCFEPETFVSRLATWMAPKEGTLSALEKQHQLYGFLYPDVNTTELKAGLQPENLAKNRDARIIPDDISRPLLQTRVPDDDTATNYINACFFNGYSKRSAFIATQAPTVVTYTDFWRMLFDYKSDIIVGFQGEDREEFPVYWPSDRAELDPFTIEHKEEEKVSDYFTIRKFQLKKVFDGSEKNPKNTRDITQFCLHNFEELDNDLQVALMVELITRRLKPRRDENADLRITVHCQYGIGLSGVFIGLVNSIDMIRGEDQIDVFTTVKLMRMARHNMVDTYENYQLINEAVKYYIQNPPPEPTESNSDVEEPDYANL